MTEQCEHCGCYPDNRPQSYEYVRAFEVAPKVMYEIVGLIDQIGKRHWWNVLHRMHDLSRCVLEELRNDINRIRGNAPTG